QPAPGANVPHPHTEGIRRGPLGEDRVQGGEVLVIAGVAGDQDVVSAAAGDRVGTPAADDEVPARAADQDVPVGVADQQVVADAAGNVGDVEYAAGRPPVDQAGQVEGQVHRDVADVVRVVQGVGAAAAVDRAVQGGRPPEGEAVVRLRADQVLNIAERRDLT